MERYTLELADDNLYTEKVKYLFSQDETPLLSTARNIAAERYPVTDSVTLITFNNLEGTYAHSLFGGRRAANGTLCQPYCSTEKHFSDDNQKSKPADARTLFDSAWVRQCPRRAEAIHDKVTLQED